VRSASNGGGSSRWRGGQQRTDGSVTFIGPGLTLAKTSAADGGSA
jgi:hypothetical protein